MLKTVSAGRSTALLALGFILFNVLDLLLTVSILQAGGYELNPLVRATLELGVPVTASLKIGASAVFAWLLCRLRLEGALRLATVIILCVCLFNVAGLTL